MSEHACADALLLTHPALVKDFNHIKQTWQRLTKLHQTNTTYMDSTSLVFLLPFRVKINQCICKTVNDGRGHVNWRLCLSALSLLVQGPLHDKLLFIEQLYGQESVSSMKRVLIDSLRCAQRIAVSLNVKVTGSAYVKESIGSAKYHGDSVLDLIADNLLMSYAECKSIGSLCKPFNFSWHSLTTPRHGAKAPCSRFKHSACVNGHSLYLMGGRDGRYLINDIWTFNLLTEEWRKLTTTGDAPPSLEEHTMVSHGNKIFVFGGISRMSVDGETPLWILNTAQNTWTHWESEGEVALPPCLKGHTAVLVERNMYIFGGYEDILGSSELMWSFDILDEQWHLAYSQSMKGTGPSPRHCHSSVLHNNSMLVIGGVNNLNPVTDMWSWSFSACNWTKVKPFSTIPIIYGHTSVKLASSIYVLGGQNQYGLSKIIWEYKIDAAVWKRVETKTANTRRAHHVSLLISPFTYSNAVAAERTHSVPLMGSAFKSHDTKRPHTTPSSEHTTILPHNRVHPISSHKTYLSARKTKNIQSDLMTSKVVVEDLMSFDQDNNNYDISHPPGRLHVMPVSKSDYGVTSGYFRSDSLEPLLESSRTLSDCPLTFDNPAYINSYDELTSQVTLGTSVVSPFYGRSITYSHLSRSLDSIQDVAHDGNTRALVGSLTTLPGVVVSRSEETVNEICTVRNVMLDECSQAWEDNSIDDILELPDEKVEDLPRGVSEALVKNLPYKLFILGGQERTRKISAVTPELVVWVGEISSQGSGSDRDQGCPVS